GLAPPGVNIVSVHRAATPFLTFPIAKLLSVRLSQRGGKFMGRKSPGAKVLVACRAAAAVPLLASAQQQPQKAPAKVIVLKAARMFDGKSNSLTTPGLVVITDNKITAVGASASVPSDAQVIDLGDATLLPGFIDAHTHLTMMHSDDWKGRALDQLQKPIAEKALDSSVNAKVTLMAGFTTVRDVGSHDQLDVGLRNAIRHGEVP